MRFRRIIGNVLGVFFLVTLATTNLYVSEPSDIKNGIRLVYHITELSLLIVPLLIPLTYVRKSELLRKILLIFLSVGTLSFFIRQIQNFIWAFQSGELLQIIMFPLISIVSISILLAQFFELNGKIYNRQVKQN